MHTVYICAKSKKAINEQLKGHYPVMAERFDINGREVVALKDMPKGTCVKVYEKKINGNPYAKSYGTWDGVKIK
jgi:hypothetical protein